MSRIKLIDISKPYYATRRFTMVGKEYQQDDLVPFDDLNERDIARLIKSTYITSIQPKKAQKPVEPVKTVTQEPVKPVEPVKVETSGPVGKIEHVGGGQYEIQDENGENMLPDRVKGKDMAKMAAEQLGISIVE